MKTNSLFHPFWMSFYSRTFYAEVITSWKGRSFIYLILLSIVLSIPIVIQMKKSISDVAQKLPEVVKQVPEIRIVGGVASTPQIRPYMIKDISSGKIFGIIDTTGRYLSLENSEAKFLLTRTKILYRQSDYETREYSIANVNDLSITNADINGWIGLADSWLAILLAPFVLIGLYVYKIIAALLYSLIAMIIALIAKINVPYSSKISLSIISMTPASLILAFFELISVPVPQNFLFSLLVTTGFMVFGIVANKNELG